MIIQPKGTDKQTSLADLLGGGVKSTGSKANGMFSKLLASLNAGLKNTEKHTVAASDTHAFKAVIEPKNAVVRSSVANSATTRELQALLGTNDSREDHPLISKELLDTLSSDQVRSLIHRAKEYLKNEISTKAPEYQNDSKPFPKSLMGLVHLADKLGLEPQSITLSALVTDSHEENRFSPQLLSQPLLDSKALTPPAAAAQTGETAEALMQLLGEIKTKESKTAKESAAPQKEEQPLKALLRQEPSPKTEPETQKSHKNDPLPQKTAHLSEEGVKHPLPAAVTEKEKNAEEKTAAPTQPSPKTEGLIALLQGENEYSEGSGESRKGVSVETEPSKTFDVPKSDTLEVKSKEAQQSMRHFATDLKEAVENYKPPFTRIAMKLNPEQLGEVEVTLVQRGNNVHVNIQSNNASSVAFLAHNATELKAQLAHQGITNATMNFMSGGENQNPQQQHHQEQSHNRFRSYTSLTELELSEEQLGALEIIIPHYA
ncbi:MAG: flagellar hook-length control protein FliK [Campylobacterales bacterium]|nr:flagellar hook-length control protein FliK [Campylobacterales bacterium]